MIDAFYLLFYGLFIPPWTNELRHESIEKQQQHALILVTRVSLGAIWNATKIEMAAARTCRKIPSAVARVLGMRILAGVVRAAGITGSQIFILLIK